MSESKEHILEQISDWLRFQKAIGVKWLPRSTHAEQFLQNSRARSRGQAPIEKSKQDVGPDRPGHEKELLFTDLSQLRSYMGECTRCPLHERRKEIVFGQGPEKTRLMLVGEAPGREEDLSGKPFVGASGELLTKMLKAIEIDRNEVYITSVVKCRPPNNRAPKADEISTCLPFLLKQIEIIKPALILALGQVAAQALIKKKGSLSSMRGRFYPLGSAKILVTYHPAYLLRLGGVKQKLFKREAWKDLQLLKKTYSELES